MPSETGRSEQLPAALRWMMRATGRRQTPSDVKALTLTPDERRLTWGRTTAGEPVVATDRGLYLSGRDRLDWWAIERAGWQRPALTVLAAAAVEGTGERVVLQLDDEGELPQVVRTQVTASVGWSAHYRLPGRGTGGVRVVGRRLPGQDDLQWQLIYDRGTDADDPIVRAEAEQLLLGARRTVG